MFTLFRYKFGLYLPALSFRMSTQEQLFSDVTIVTDTADEALDVPPFAATFVSGGTTYNFPLSGSDFLTKKTGDLTLILESPHAAGEYIYPFLSQVTTPSVMGIAVAGQSAPGGIDSVMSTPTISSVLLSLQTGFAAYATQPYIVKTVILPR